MATLAINRDAAAVVTLVVDRVYTFTPAANCTIGIGPEPGGRVAHNVSYAQLQAGLTYEFITRGADLHLTGLSRRDAANLTYVNVRARPP